MKVNALYGENSILRKLAYTRFKHIDFYNFDVDEFNLRMTGIASGLHKYIIGMYNLEFFNWKTKDYYQKSTYITPFDTYAFRDNTVNFYKIHYKRDGVETTVYRGSDKDWMVGIKIKNDNPKIEVDIDVIENHGISHLDTIDGQDKRFWLRRYGNFNCKIRKGIYKMKGTPRRITENSKFEMPATMFHYQIKGMVPYKAFAYMRAHFQTPNLEKPKIDIIIEDVVEKSQKEESASYVNRPGYVARNKKEDKPKIEEEGDMIHFTYGIEADTRSDSEDLIQYIAVGKRIYKLEPTLHEVKDPSKPLTENVRFYTKDIGLFSERIVDLKFSPFFNAPQTNLGNYVQYNTGYLVYGKWNGYVIDNKGKKFRIINARGTISYGTMKF